MGIREEARDGDCSESKIAQERNFLASRAGGGRSIDVSQGSEGYNILSKSLSNTHSAYHADNAYRQILNKKNEFWSLYTFIVDGGDGECYFKIGITQSLEKRLDQLSVMCPLPIKKVLLAPGFTKGNVLEMEKRMHQELKPYHARGEWFRFDISDSEHKKAFKDATDKVVAPFAVNLTGKPFKWVHYDMEEAAEVLKNLNKERGYAKNRGKTNFIRNLLAQQARYATKGLRTGTLSAK